MLPRAPPASSSCECADVVVAKLEHASARSGSAPASRQLWQSSSSRIRSVRPTSAGITPTFVKIAAAEDDGVFGALQRRELALELDVERMVAVDEPRGAGARAVAARRFDAGRDDLGVMRQAQVVVARERHELGVGLQSAPWRSGEP